MDIQKFNRILMRTVAALLVALLVSAGMITGRYARYTSAGDGSAEARVARFRVTGTAEGFAETRSVSLSMVPGERKEIRFTVENDSEVSIECTLNADNPYRNFPLVFSVEEDTGDSPVPFTARMEPGQTGDYILVAQWQGSRDISYSGKVDLIEITLLAVQAD